MLDFARENHELPESDTYRTRDLGESASQQVYPPDESAVAVIDTGHEGFLSIPHEIFEKLALEELRIETRTLSLADGSRLTAEGAYATLRLRHLLKTDGFVETHRGADEIILGSGTLSRFRVLLDYCSKRILLERYP